MMAWGLVDMHRYRKVLITLIIGPLLISINLGVPYYSTSGQVDLDEPDASENGSFNLSQVLTYMDTRVDPCQDFHLYACGGFVNRTIIPQGYNTWNQFLLNTQEIYEDLRGILESPDTIYDGQAVKAAKIYYDSCVDTEGIREKLGAAPLIAYLSPYNGWESLISSPIHTNDSIFVEEFNGTKRITYPHYEVTRDSNPYFVELSVFSDPKNASRYLLTVTPGRQTLPNKDIYDVNASPKNLKLFNAFLAYMKNLGKLLMRDTNHSTTLETPDANIQGVEKISGSLNNSNITPLRESSQSDHMLEKNMRDVLNFEGTLAKFRPSPKELKTLNSNNYQLLTLAQLDASYPFMNWTRFVTQIIETNNISLPPNYKLRIKAPNYLSNLTNVIQNYLQNETTIRTLQNYIIWQKIKSLPLKLSKEYRQSYHPVRVANNRAEYEQIPIWKRCLIESPEYLDYPLSTLYVRKYFKAGDKARVEGMVKMIKEAYKERIGGLDWMDGVTKDRSKEKVDALGYKIGYPDYLVNMTELDKEYTGINMIPEAHFDNYLNQLRTNEHQTISKLLQPVDKRKWYIPPHSVNAYFLASQNEIVFLAGILRKPFYDTRYPTPLIYGAIGSVIAHEITHGFDDNGRKYDKTGNWKLWWTNETIKSFVNKTHCFVDQYSSYNISDIKLNGNQTLGDDLADNGGIAISHQALKNWRQSGHPSRNYTLDGITLTADQLFFLAFAHAFCSKETPERLYVQIKTDYHSPAKYRIIGSVSNSPQFAKAFNCPVDSPMNPTNKCSIW